MSGQKLASEHAHVARSVAVYIAASLQANSSQTNILRVEIPGVMPVFSGISLVSNQIQIESNQ